MPVVTLGMQIEPKQGGLEIRRETTNGYTVVQVKLPAVITITNDKNNVLRMPKVRDRMMARSKPIKVLGAGDVDVNARHLQPGIRLELVTVVAEESSCEMLPGEGGPEKAKALVERLRKLQLV